MTSELGDAQLISTIEGKALMALHLLNSCRQNGDAIAFKLDYENQIAQMVTQ